MFILFFSFYAHIFIFLSCSLTNLNNNNRNRISFHYIHYISNTKLQIESNISDEMFLDKKLHVIVTSVLLSCNIFRCDLNYLNIVKYVYII